MTPIFCFAELHTLSTSVECSVKQAQHSVIPGTTTSKGDPTLAEVIVESVIETFLWFKRNLHNENQENLNSRQLVILRCHIFKMTNDQPVDV